ncbi:conserved exported hypothetical protein [Frankia sp. AiPs1]|uniref:hypothetical protein n=1 Tax=Frankia sp. AiPa1 TaxID=573492 RepID=UPI00202B1D56|nr:hypothetical protein [Frankia sp. AiPa1]MCL9760785.1 hypothetical protein [Frankia sp. AiPa1]
MRSTGTRAVVAGFLGMAAIMLATPAAVASPTATGSTPTESTAGASSPSATPSTVAATTATLGAATGAPDAETTASASPDASTTTPAVAGLTPDSTATTSADATPLGPPEASATPSATASSTGAASTGDENLDHFLDLLPFRVPFDKEINGIEDIDVNPLVLTFTCTDGLPSWQLRNASDKSFGFGWFDTNLGGGILDIGPQQTIPLTSKALAVIGSPWDAETKELLVAVPTIGVSNCGGATATLPAAALPAALPAAAPAAAGAVQAEPYYTG